MVIVEGKSGNLVKENEALGCEPIKGGPEGAKKNGDEVGAVRLLSMSLKIFY